MSCVQDLEDQPATFIKVLGKEAKLVARGQAITKLDNGHLLIYGSGSRFMYDNAEEVFFPFIIETDEFGNEVQYRTYPIFEGAFDLYFTSWGFSSNEFTTDMDWWAGIWEIRPLQDGRYFAIGQIDFTNPEASFWNPFYLVLDADLNLIKWDWFNDTEIENTPICERQIPFVMQGFIQETTGGDIFFLHSHSACNNLGFNYSVLKFSSQAELMNVWDYGSGSEYYMYRASGWTQKANGNLVVAVRKMPYGQYIDSISANIVFHELDPNTGELLREVEYNKDKWGVPWNILPDEQGFVAQHYSGETTWNEDIGGRILWGDLIFLNDNLDSIRSVHVTGTANIFSGGPFIRTRDGGLITAYRQNTAFNYRSIMFKTDAEGNMLWRHEEPAEGLYIGISGLTEMDDGGIVFVTSDVFNQSQNKILLKKLTADGQLQ